MPSRDWSRLARYVRERRDELGLTQEEVAGRGGPSTATLRLIEGAAQDAYRAKSLRQLADALGWTPDSPLAILGGREPQLAPGLTGSAATPTAAQADLAAVRAGHLDDIDRRTVDLVDALAKDKAAQLKAEADAAKAANPNATGADIWPDEPFLADVWNMQSYTEDEKLIAMAVFLIRRPLHRLQDERDRRAG